MTRLKDIKTNPQILEFVKMTEISLAALSYTDHGLRHSNLVADRALEIAKNTGLSEREGDLAAIAAFCHDMGNFLGRKNHDTVGALLFSQVFGKDFPAKELGVIMNAIASHDERDMNLSSAVAAVVVLADKSDVHRSRVITKVLDQIKTDIHDRVNYATKNSSLRIDKTKKMITLNLKIDTNFVPIIEYFEIFTERMVYCRKAAEYLGYRFGLVINKFRLL